MEWKRIVRYMYEYENDRKVRNTGFIRFDFSEKVCKAYIHGKGICAEDLCNIYAFYESDDAVVRIPLGYVRMKSGNLNGYVEMDAAHVGNTDIPFEQIDGIMIGENRERRYLVFLKNERAFGGTQEASDLPQEREDSSLEHAKTASREPEEPEEEGEPEEQGKEEAAPEKIEMMADLPPETEEVVSEEFAYRRIGPRDLGVLRREDRHLANNSFLLHGYYNYRHLLLSEDEDQYILGVPGVFMEREKRAASMFGFSQFMEAEEYGIPTPMEAREHKAAFGYWCRHLPKQ